ncbi:hypothetical protein [Thermoflexibacter ruber]|uniref:Uncharacterized protein n=1 Tax=Thermoflexibacter ruber TaxID=1003 RepID=A0A1I2I1Y2_9BACT|nr:hypothetical protein [Thermoflexibacter ruber]SFF36409.1 hypothetical protein SAMN04488541_102845 [Thermoflexibacter ruber]
MKKFFALVLSLHFLAISFLPNDGVLELFKVSHLIKHFTHHQVVHQEDIDFLEFLTLHYLDPVHQQKDAHEHTDLPFQSSVQHISHVHFVFLPPPSFAWSMEWEDFPTIKSYKTTYQESYFSAFHLSIWQPPRV